MFILEKRKHQGCCYIQSPIHIHIPSTYIRQPRKYITHILLVSKYHICVLVSSLQRRISTKSSMSQRTFVFQSFSTHQVYKMHRETQLNVMQQQHTLKRDNKKNHAPRSPAGRRTARRPPFARRPSGHQARRGQHWPTRQCRAPGVTHDPHAPEMKQKQKRSTKNDRQKRSTKKRNTSRHVRFRLTIN